METITPLYTGLGCLQPPNDGEMCVFECSFCNRQTFIYSFLWEYSDLQCAHCPHTHIDSHYVFKITSDGSVLRTDCTQCRIYFFREVYICWSCDNPSRLTGLKLPSTGSDSECKCVVTDGISGQKRVCKFPLDSSCRVEWYGGKSVSEWSSYRKRSLAGWKFEDDQWSLEHLQMHMIRVDEPGVVTKELEAMEPVGTWERVWEESNMHVYEGELSEDESEDSEEDLSYWDTSDEEDEG